MPAQGLLVCGLYPKAMPPQGFWFWTGSWSVAEGGVTGLQQ